jgi:hypothetical protein
MAQTNYQGFLPQASLADELSRLISDPRTQSAITSITLRDGTSVQLNPKRKYCDICENFLVDGDLLDVHKLSCRATCKLHNLVEPNCVRGTYKGVEAKALDHAVDPTYTYTCCFMEKCNSPERIPSGWTNMEIMEHVIRSHTQDCLGNGERQQLLQGIRRTQRRPT